MKLKILSNVKHNSTALAEGDIVDIEEAHAKALIESGAAEESKSKVTKKAPKPDHGKMELHLTSKPKPTKQKKG